MKSINDKFSPCEEVARVRWRRTLCCEGLRIHPMYTPALPYLPLSRNNYCVEAGMKSINDKFSPCKEVPVCAGGVRCAAKVY